MRTVGSGGRESPNARDPGDREIENKTVRRLSGVPVMPEDPHSYDDDAPDDANAAVNYAQKQKGDGAAIGSLNRPPASKLVEVKPP